MKLIQAHPRIKDSRAGSSFLPRRSLITSLLALSLSPDVLGALAPELSNAELPASLQAHPRLLIGASDISQLRERRGHEPLLDAFIKRLETDARAVLDRPVCSRVMSGKRLLWISREVMRRVLVLAIAWYMDEDKVRRSILALRAQQEMLAAARFSDWNPSHFLDVAEMTTALALGLDWLYPALSEPARAEIIAAIAIKGLEPAQDKSARHNHWRTARNNWNQVCWSGLTLGALAIWEEQPALARQTVQDALEHIEAGLAPYAPDGVYPEGPGYWSYGTHFQVLMIAGLHSALGHDFGFSGATGLMDSAAFMRQVQGPSGRYFNFGDAGETLALQPVLFWFASQRGQWELVNDQIERIERFSKGEDPGLEAARLLPLLLVWWPQAGLQRSPTCLPLVWQGGADVPLAVVRSAWDQPGAFYLAAKGGSAALNHAHMDAGSFVLEAAGVRWAIDLGLQDYLSLESKGLRIWDRHQTADRWRVFRYHNLTHNTLSLDGQSHVVTGVAKVAPIASIGPDHYRFTIDLGAVLSSSGVKATRTFDVWPDAARVQITDSLSDLPAGAQIQWTMVTGAQVEVDGTQAILRQDGKCLSATLSGVDQHIMSFEAASTDPPDDGFNAPNPGRTRLLVRSEPTQNGSVQIRVTLSSESRA